MNADDLKAMPDAEVLRLVNVGLQAEAANRVKLRIFQAADEAVAELSAMPPEEFAKALEEHKGKGFMREDMIVQYDDGRANRYKSALQEIIKGDYKVLESGVISDGPFAKIARAALGVNEDG